MKYFFKWKRLNNYFWQKALVTGHQLDPVRDTMILYFEDGSQRTIVKFLECETSLGPDWALAVKASMEKEAGQNIKLNIKGG